MGILEDTVRSTDMDERRGIVAPDVGSKGVAETGEATILGSVWP